MGRISLPHLVDVDWTIIVKKASSEVSNMNVPALLVELDVEQIPTRVDEPPEVEKVCFLYYLSFHDVDMHVSPDCFRLALN